MANGDSPGVSIDIKPTAPQGPWQRYQATPTVDTNAKPWERYSRNPAQAEVSAPAPSQTDTQSSEGTAAQPSATSAEPTSALGKALEPITSYPQAYGKVRGEAQEQLGAGLSELGKGTGAQVGKGLWNTAFGAMRFVGSPIEAGLHTVAGKPLEENLGIPHEYSEFALGLAIPYYGLKGGKPPVPGGSPAAPTGFNKLFRPEAIKEGTTPGGPEAAASIRQETGTAARTTATTEAALEPSYPTVAAMSPAERTNLLGYMEGTHPGPLPAEQQKLADTLRTEFEKRANELRNLSSSAQMNFIQDYFPHMWQDPKAAANFAQNWGGGVGKQGSRASLKARTVPTIQDGLNAGLKLVSDDPIYTAMRYVTSMDRFIASERILESGETSGVIVRGKPQFMGATGTPARAASPAKGVPDGYVPLKGRGATDHLGRQAYAPEHWARVYNNFISRGAHDLSEDLGKVVDTARRASNAVTAVELSMSAYHALTMAQEAAVNELGRAIQEGTKGHVWKGLKSAAKTATAFITLPLRGKKAQDIYLGKTMGSPQDREVVDLLTQAGGRLTGRRHALDVDFEKTGAGSYWTAWKRGALQSQLKADATALATQTYADRLRTVFKHVGRAMDTMAHPLFQQYIPKLKAGAAMDNMGSWLQTHPTATQAEKLEAARRIVDSVDNRFGEMIQDNIFWNQAMKQVAMTGLRSYSWTMGTIREIGGGVKDIRDPKTPGEISQRTAYIIALPIVYGTMSAMYQYMKTGERPKDIQDIVAPRTGGTTETGAPERIIPPGYMKDVFGWTRDPVGEASNKIATAPKLTWQMINNKDWRGKPIAPGADTPDKAVQDYFMYSMKAVAPISTKTRTSSETNISGFERFLGIQPAGMQYTDPDKLKKIMARKGKRELIQQKIQEKIERKRGGLGVE